MVILGYVLRIEGEMILVDTDKKLEERLKQMCQKAGKSTYDGLSSEGKAYVRGIEDALKLVCLHRQQCADAKKAISKAAGKQQDDAGAVKLFQMSPEQVCNLNLDAEDDVCLRNFSQDELAEAAFRFENELMTCLGDANCIEWDIYAGLTPTELVKVVTKSVSDICKYNKG